MLDEQKITDYIVKAAAPVQMRELLRHFRINPANRREFKKLLRNLERAGKIQQLRGKSYTAPTGKTSGVIGRLEVTSKGFGFVRPDWSNISGKPPFSGDVFIPPRMMGAALDGDWVRAEVIRIDDEGPSGKISEVLDHAHKVIVGQYMRTGTRSAIVRPRNRRIERDIEVPPAADNLQVENHDWVEVEVTEFTPPPALLYGKVKGRIGTEEDRGIDVLLVLRDLGILEEFPAAVEEQVEAMDFNWEQDLRGRKDFRGVATFTIDPDTAKDYDDGLSIEEIRGGWRLYVHIADVAHFVKMGTPLDREAEDRATSVYPVDRVVPMLPERLSNNLCSLVPNQDRLTMTAIMEISKDGALKKSEVHSSVIHSDRRFTYNEVQAIFDEREDAPAISTEVRATLLELRAVARVLREARFKRGALDLDIPEVKIIFDEHGAASDLKFYERYEAHQLVEECMLIANEAVAQLLTKKEVPLLYRIHETADQERLERLEPVLAAFGIKLGRGDGGITPFDLQSALDKAQGMEAGHVLRRLVLRALKRAEYDSDNVGHFGLASECYCHFTSPIRRYPDVVVHRQLKGLEPGGRLAYDPEENDLDTLGDHCSQRERRAQEAEWESTEIKAIEFMTQYVGDEFEAHILSVHNFGMFVELSGFPVEGFIPIRALQGDYFQLDELGIMLKGKRSGRVYKISQKVQVRLDRADPMARQMTLTLLEQETAPQNRQAHKRPWLRGGGRKRRR